MFFVIGRNPNPLIKTIYNAMTLCGIFLRRQAENNNFYRIIITLIGIKLKQTQQLDQRLQQSLRVLQMPGIELEREVEN